MAHSKENFKEWISCIPDKMDKFTQEFAGNNHLILDYTMASLDDLESWILVHYHDANELTNDSSTLDYITIYIGETFRRYLGGEWDIDIDNKEDAHHPIITLTDASYKGESQIAPMTIATECISRNKENSLNAFLNYGYQILLSTFNKEIVANGYLTQIGLFHKNMFNYYNLSSPN